jgi:hypothetical protein
MRRQRRARRRMKMMRLLVSTRNASIKDDNN